MKQQTRVRDALFADIVVPLFRGPYYVLKGIYWILFGWWLEPRSQRKANQALADDVRANLNFLFSSGELADEGPTPIHPFDYAVVRIDYGNICFYFARGRGELNISLAPRHAPKRSHELALVIAALESSNLILVNGFREIAAVLHPRLDALNRAFSESQYPSLGKKLP